jgi:hypothetical protein
LRQHGPYGSAATKPMRTTRTPKAPERLSR